MLRRHCVTIVIGLCLMSLGCAGNPPVDEMASAKVAVGAARDVQAQVYAVEEYQMAEKTFRRAKREFNEKNFDIARTLFEIASLQAKHALAVTNWKIKANRLQKNQKALRKAMKETEEARLLMEEAKKQLH